MARGNLAAVRGAVGACKEAERWAAARRRKSPTSEVDVRLDLHPVGTATEGSTLVRDLTRPLNDSLRSRPVRAGARRSRASGAEATKRPKLNPRPPEPHANGYSTESPQRVATTRCSGHRCCDSDPEDRPGIAAESQRNSQRATLGPRPVRWRIAQCA